MQDRCLQIKSSLGQGLSMKVGQVIELGKEKGIMINKQNLVVNGKKDHHL